MTATVTALRAPRPVGQQIDAPPRTSWIRLLHVEDNAADAALIQAYLRTVLPDVAFDTASRLADVTAERANAADCAILDLSLPDASGLEALLALRGMSDRLPIIVLTGFDDLPLGLTALGSGAEDYLVKNHVDGPTLERAVRYAIERRRLSLEALQHATATASLSASSGAAESAYDRAARSTAPSASPTSPRGTAPLAQVVMGPHEVTVGIDPTTGEYALECQVCSWQAVRGPADLHSWSERSLGWALLSHVDFGGLEQEYVAAPVEPVAAVTPASDIAAPSETSTGPYAIGKFVARRALFSIKGWLQE